jgi:hypothetical protein
VSVQNLPEAIKFSTGEVFDLKGDKSGQIDIILVSDAAPKIHLYGAVNLFPVETVLGVIEVKSNLTSGAKGELLKVLAHCKRLKKLYKMDRAHQEAAYLKSESYKFYSVPYIVFAYAGCSSDILITTLKGQISSACNHLKDMPDLIVVLDRGYTLSKNSGFLIEGATIDTVYTKNIEPEVVLLDLYKYLIILVDYWISNPQCFRIPLNYTESVNNMDDIFGV